MVISVVSFSLLFSIPLYEDITIFSFNSYWIYYFYFFSLKSYWEHS